LDEDGYPKNNPKAKVSIQAWEQKNHKKADLIANDAQTTLLIIADDLQEQNDLKCDEREVEQKKWDKLNDEWHTTDNAIHKFEEDGYVTESYYNTWNTFLETSKNATLEITQQDKPETADTINNTAEVDEISVQDPFKN